MLTANPASRVLVSSQETPVERMARWREALQPLFRVERLDHSAGAEIDLYHLGELIVGRFRAPGQVFRRHEGIEALEADGMLALLILDGELAATVDEVEVHAIPGDLVLFDQSRPYSASSSSAEVMFVQGPTKLLAPRPGEDELFHGSVLRGSNPSCQLFQGYLRQLYASCPRLMGQDVSRVGNALASLLRSTVRGFVEDDATGEQEGDGANLPEPFRRYVETHLASSDLSAEAMGNAFGMSRAALYRLFAPTGGVARYIRMQRLRRAMKDIADPAMRHLRFSAIAQQWGFDNANSLSKAMRREFNLTPRDLRRRALADARKADPKLGSRTRPKDRQA